MRLGSSRRAAGVAEDVGDDDDAAVVLTREICIGTPSVDVRRVG